MKDWSKNDFLTETRRRQDTKKSGNLNHVPIAIRYRIRSRLREIVDGLSFMFLLEESACSIEWNNLGCGGFSVMYFRKSQWYNNQNVNILNVQIQNDFDSLLVKTKYYPSDNVKDITRKYTNFSESAFDGLYEFKVVKLFNLLDSIILTDFFIALIENAKSHMEKHGASDYMSAIHSYGAYSYQPVFFDYPRTFKQRANVDVDVSEEAMKRMKEALANMLKKS